MNRRQLVAMWVGILVIVAMGVFPPGISDWAKSSYRGGGICTTHEFSGYKVLWNSDADWVEWTRLGLQWGVVALVTGGLMVTFRRRDAGR